MVAKKKKLEFLFHKIHVILKNKNSLGAKEYKHYSLHSDQLQYIKLQPSGLKIEKKNKLIP